MDQKKQPKFMHELMLCCFGVVSLPPTWHCFILSLPYPWGLCNYDSEAIVTELWNPLLLPQFRIKQSITRDGNISLGASWVCWAWLFARLGVETMDLLANAQDINRKLTRLSRGIPPPHLTSGAHINRFFLRYRSEVAMVNQVNICRWMLAGLRGLHKVSL